MYSGFVARRLQGFLNSNSSLLCYAVNWPPLSGTQGSPANILRAFAVSCPRTSLIAPQRSAEIGHRAFPSAIDTEKIRRGAHPYHRRACCSLGEGASSEAEPQSLPKAQHGGGLRSAGSTPSSCSLLGAIEPTDCRNFLRNCNDDTTVFCSL
jgi:hypothetical protein